MEKLRVLLEAATFLTRQKVSHFNRHVLILHAVKKYKNVCIKLLEMKLAFSQGEKAEEGAHAPSSYFYRALILSKFFIKNDAVVAPHFSRSENVS